MIAGALLHKVVLADTLGVVSLAAVAESSDRGQ